MKSLIVSSIWQRRSLNHFRSGRETNSVNRKRYSNPCISLLNTLPFGLYEYRCMHIHSYCIQPSIQVNRWMNHHLLQTTIISYRFNKPYKRTNTIKWHNSFCNQYGLCSVTPCNVTYLLIHPEDAHDRFLFCWNETLMFTRIWQRARKQILLMPLRSASMTSVRCEVFSITL